MKIIPRIKATLAKSRIFDQATLTKGALNKLVLRVTAKRLSNKVPEIKRAKLPRAIKRLPKPTKISSPQVVGFHEEVAKLKAGNKKAKEMKNKSPLLFFIF